jgi:glycosyltransferase involved in cell wall biosynthesis
VPPSSPAELAQALVGLLKDEQHRLHFASRFQTRVEQQYSPRRIMCQICEVYNAVLNVQ